MNEQLEAYEDLRRIAAAVWPEGASERPADLDEGGATADQLVAGVRSLHEFADRVCAENGRLRDRVLELEADALEAPELSSRDRADISVVLAAYAGMCDESAGTAQSTGGTVVARSLAAKVLRMRELITLLAVLLLCACMEQPPPPYTVYFAASVPQADREVFAAAAADWNAAVGGDPVFIASDEPPRGRCGVEVAEVASRPADEPAEALNGMCLGRIEYARGRAEKCLAVHELGHRLIEGHVRGTIMDAYGCDYDPVVTPELARRVKERWGL